MWEEDQEVLKRQRHRILVLIEDNHRLMELIATLKS